MSKWNDRFATHAIHETMASLEAQLAQAEDMIHENPDAAADFMRVRDFHERVRAAIGAAEPEFAPLGPLNALQGHIQEQVNQLAAFLSAPASSNLSSAARQVDNIASQLIYFPQPSETKEIELLRDAVASARRSAAQHMRYLEEQYKAVSQAAQDVESRMKELRTEIDSQKSRLDVAISQFQQQYSDAESQRASLFTQAEQKRADDATKSKAALETLEQTMKALFEEKARVRTEEFEAEKQQFQNSLSTVLDSASKQLEGIRASLESSFNSDLEALRTESSDVINTLDQRRAEAEKLVNIIANTGMSGGYQKVANRDARAGLVWETLAALSLVGFVVFAVWAAVYLFNEDFHWGHLTARIFVTAAFAGFSAYAGSRAEKRRDSERRNRRIELEMASLNSFLAELPETEQHAIKKQVAERLFGNIEPSKNAVAGSPLPIDLNNPNILAVAQILKVLLDTGTRK